MTFRETLLERLGYPVGQSCDAVMEYDGERVRCGRDDGMEQIDGVWLCGTHAFSAKPPPCTDDTARPAR